MAAFFATAIVFRVDVPSFLAPALMTFAFLALFTLSSGGIVARECSMTPIHSHTQDRDQLLLPLEASTALLNGRLGHASLAIGYQNPGQPGST